MDHQVKRIERGYRWSERFENVELEMLFQQYCSKVQNRSTFLIFALGNAIFALTFHLSAETAVLTLVAMSLFALWALERLYGRGWMLTTGWVMSAILFALVWTPLPVPHRVGKIDSCGYIFRF
jgi:hypothetical protein